jgi:hypothetical protein
LAGAEQFDSERATAAGGSFDGGDAKLRASRRRAPYDRTGFGGSVGPAEHNFRPQTVGEGSGYALFGQAERHGRIRDRPTGGIFNYYFNSFARDPERLLQRIESENPNL